MLLGKVRYTKDHLKRKLHNTKTYYKYKNITLEDVQPLIDYFGKIPTQRLLSKYERIFEDVVIAEREEFETKLLIWMEEIMQRVKQGEFESMERIEKYYKLEAELIELLKQK